MGSISNLRTGLKIMFQNQPHEVVKFDHLKMGRGGAVVRTKLRNIITGSVIDFTFNSSESFDEADVYFEKAQFLYFEGEIGHFMLSKDYSQVAVEVPKAKANFLLEGQDLDLIFWKDQVIDVKLPPKIVLAVEYTEPGFKGDTASATTKPATMETGGVVNVPLFINVGDKIRINTETLAYVERA